MELGERVGVDVSVTEGLMELVDVGVTVDVAVAVLVLVAVAVALRVDGAKPL